MSSTSANVLKTKRLWEVSTHLGKRGENLGAGSMFFFNSMSRHTVLRTVSLALTCPVILYSDTRMCQAM